MNIRSILNVFGGTPPASAPGPTPGAPQVRSLPTAGAGLSVLTEQSGPTPIPIRTTVLPTPAESPESGQGRGIMRFAPLLAATQDASGVWHTTSRPRVTPEIWNAVFDPDQNKTEIAALKEIYPRSRNVDRRLEEASVRAIGHRLAQARERFKSTIRGGGDVTTAPVGREQAIAAAQEERQSLRELQAEISNETFRLVKVIVARIENNAADTALDLYETEKAAAARFGFPWSPSSAFLSFLFVRFGAAQSVIRNALYGLPTMKPERVLLGQELWPPDDEEVAAANAEIDRQRNEQQELADRQARQQELAAAAGSQAAQAEATKKAEKLAEINALHDLTRAAAAAQKKPKADTAHE